MQSKPNPWEEDSKSLTQTLTPILILIPEKLLSPSLSWVLSA